MATSCLWSAGASSSPRAWLQALLRRRRCGSPAHVAALASSFAGGVLLSEGSEALVGSGEAIAAGALLAVISISIVPYAFLRGAQPRGDGDRARVRRRLPSQLNFQEAQNG